MSDADSRNPPEDALLDLLIKQITEGLSAEEQRALEGMDGATMSAYAKDLEHAVAAIDVAASASDQELPPFALRSRIEQDALAFIAANNIAELTPRKAVEVQARSGAAGWYAAAACLLLALFGWLRSPQTNTAPSTASTAAVPPTVAPPPTPPPPPTLAQERAALLALPGSVRVTLGATKDPAATGVTADVVWDPVTQRGFMHFVGLKPNDPRIQQYQAWIFDAERDKRYPVDAGVFDAPADSSEVIVPFRARLPVHVAKAFAVTVEKSGGVVVSALQHVVVLGTAEPVS
jgi:Anti-sigma-K factor rskA